MVSVTLLLEYFFGLLWSCDETVSLIVWMQDIRVKMHSSLKVIKFEPAATMAMSVQLTGLIGGGAEMGLSDPFYFV